LEILYRQVANAQQTPTKCKWGWGARQKAKRKARVLTRGLRVAQIQGVCEREYVSVYVRVASVKKKELGETQAKTGQPFKRQVFTDA
jgi:uncharacterized protein (DUF427 family)